MMKFQRNFSPLCIPALFKRILLVLYQKIFFNKVNYFHFVKLADFARSTGFLWSSVNLANIVIRKSQSQADIFWATQVKATSLQYAFRYKEADRAFIYAISISPGEYEKSFALQHIGKSKMEQGETKTALAYLNCALKIRKKIGNRNLINSTLLAVSAVKKDLKKKDDG